MASVATKIQRKGNTGETLDKILEGLQVFERAVKRCCKQRRSGTFSVIFRVEDGRVTQAHTKSHLMHHGDRKADCTELEENGEDIHV